MSLSYVSRIIKTGGTSSSRCFIMERGMDSIKLYLPGSKSDVTYPAMLGPTIRNNIEVCCRISLALLALLHHGDVTLSVKEHNFELVLPRGLASDDDPSLEVSLSHCDAVEMSCLSLNSS